MQVVDQLLEIDRTVGILGRVDLDLAVFANGEISFAPAGNFVQVGGVSGVPCLADVVGALPLQLERLGVAVSVIIPRYRGIDLRIHDFKPYPLTGDREFDVQLSVMPHSSVRVFLIGIDRYFNRDGIYTDASTGSDYPDQPDR